MPSEDGVIGLKQIYDSGVVGSIKHGVKLLGDKKARTLPSEAQGADEDLRNPTIPALNLEVSKASKSAIEAVEAAGGTITTVYHNKLALRAEIKPESFAKKARPIPRRARPTPKLMPYYTSDENRGEFSQLVQLRKVGLLEADRA